MVDVVISIDDLTQLNLSTDITYKLCNYFLTNPHVLQLLAFLEILMNKTKFILYCFTFMQKYDRTQKSCINMGKIMGYTNEMRHKTDKSVLTINRVIVVKIAKHL